MGQHYKSKSLKQCRFNYGPSIRKRWWRYMISGRWIDQYRFFLAPLPNQLFDGGSGISEYKNLLHQKASLMLSVYWVLNSRYRHDFSNGVSAGLSYRYPLLVYFLQWGVDLGDEDISFQDLHFMLNKSEGKTDEIPLLMGE